MITIQKLINCSGYGTSILAYDDLLEVDLLIRDEFVTVLKEGELIGTFNLKTIVFDYDIGYMEFLSESDETYFYGQILSVLYPALSKYLMCKPYTGKRW